MTGYTAKQTAPGFWQKIWNKLNAIFRDGEDAASRNGSGSGHDNGQQDKVNVVDVSGSIDEMMERLDEEMSVAKMETEFQRCVMNVANNDYVKLGQQDGVNDIQRQLSGSCKANANLFVTAFQNILKDIRLNLNRDLATAESNCRKMQDAFEEDDTALKINKIYADHHPGKFSAYNAWMYMLVGVILMFAEYLMILGAVEHLGIGGNNEQMDIIAQWAYAVGVCLGAFVIKLAWDQYFNRHDASRKLELDALRQSLKDAAAPPPDKATRATRWMQAALPVVIIMGLIYLYVFSIFNLSWVRVDNHHYFEETPAENGLTAEQVNQAILAGPGTPMPAAAPSAAGGPDVGKAAEDRKSWHLFWSFMGFSILFAVLSGIFLSFGAYVRSNRWRLRKMKKAFAIAARKLAEQDGVVSELKSRNTLIINMEQEYGPQKTEVISAMFEENYNQGFAVAINDRAKRTPLLMKYRN